MRKNCYCCSDTLGISLYSGLITMKYLRPTVSYCNVLDNEVWLQPPSVRNVKLLTNLLQQMKLKQSIIVCAIYRESYNLTNKSHYQ